MAEKTIERNSTEDKMELRKENEAPIYIHCAGFFSILLSSCCDLFCARSLRSYTTYIFGSNSEIVGTKAYRYSPMVPPD